MSKTDIIFLAVFLFLLGITIGIRIGLTYAQIKLEQEEDDTEN